LRNRAREEREEGKEVRVGYKTIRIQINNLDGMRKGNK